MSPLRNALSKILIFTGIAMVLVSIAYEALNYPWRAVLGLSLSEVGEPLSPGGLPDEIDIVEYDGSVESGEKAPYAEPLMPGEDTISSPAGTVGPQAAQSAASAAPSAPRVQYVLLGTFKIPRLAVSVNLYEGSDNQLRYGVGHVTGTVLPGRKGNSVFGGHRSYIRMHPFRHLDKLKEGDNAVIAFDGHVFTYTVFESFFVQPDETWVMREIEGEPYAATFITCDPVLRPTRRLIVRARLTDADGMTPDAFFGAEEAAAPEGTQADADDSAAGQTASGPLSEEPSEETADGSSAESSGESSAETAGETDIQAPSDEERIVSPA